MSVAIDIDSDAANTSASLSALNSLGFSVRSRILRLLASDCQTGSNPFGGQNRIAAIKIAVDLLFRDVTGKSIWKEKGHEERIALRKNQQTPKGLPI
jgi:hypothetical protein